MDHLVEILKEINVPQILIILFGMWGFYNRLDKKIEKSHSFLCSKIEKSENSLSTRIDNLSSRISVIETKIAVIESRLGDISTNVTHLMWQNQIPKQDAQEK